MNDRIHLEDILADNLVADIKQLRAENKRLRGIILAHHAAGERIVGEKCELCPPNLWHEEEKA